MNKLSFLKQSKKSKITILGCGWVGYSLACLMKRKNFDVTIVSPRNHFLFTPLLTTTTVGTLEFRNVTEPVRNLKDVKYVQATCEKIIPEKNQIECKNVYTENNTFSLNYDLLVVAPGATTNTFNVPGVKENCLFMKQLRDAQIIRSRISEVFERCNTPGVTETQRQELLTFVIVGAGPASVEFTSELHDFLTQDASRIFPDYKKYLQVHLIEVTNQILGMFCKDIRHYILKMFKDRNVEVHLNTSVKKIEKGKVFLSTGKTINTKNILWNTGNKMLPFVENLPFSKDARSKRILTDSFCRVLDKDEKAIENVFSFGDCGMIKTKPLPPTAQVAYQQAKWLSNILNKKKFDEEIKPFEYNHAGTLAYIGGHKAVFESKHGQLKGMPAWAVWNMVYISKLFSFKNRMMVPISWFSNFMFGRNVSNF